MTGDAAALTHLLVHSLHEGFTVVWVTHEDGKTVGSESVGFSTRDLTLNPASPSPSAACLPGAQTTASEPLSSPGLGDSLGILSTCRFWYSGSGVGPEVLYS